MCAFRGTRKECVVFMIKKISRLFLVLGALLFCLILTSCFKREKFTFKEGKYEYSGEQFVFYNDIKIDYISLNFKSGNVSNNETNILMNRKNNISYYVDFYIENEKNEGVSCTFKSLGIVGDQVDRYYIILDISNFINVENATFEIVLEFFNSKYYSEDECDFEADQIFMSLKKFKINDVAIKDDSFPSRLLLEYRKEV